MNIELDKKTWRDEWFDKVYDEFCDYYVDDGGHDKQLKNKIISSIEELLRKQRENCITEYIKLAPRPDKNIIYALEKAPE